MLDVTTGPVVVHPDTGRRLTYRLRGKTAGHRAVMAAAHGRSIDGLTDRQLARIYNISVSALHAARRLSPLDRAAVVRGMRPLIGPQERLEAMVRRAGAEAVWNALVKSLDNAGGVSSHE